MRLDNLAAALRYAGTIPETNRFTCNGQTYFVDSEGDLMVATGRKETRMAERDDWEQITRPTALFLVAGTDTASTSTGSKSETIAREIAENLDLDDEQSDKLVQLIATLKTELSATA